MSFEKPHYFKIIISSLSIIWITLTVIPETLALSSHHTDPWEIVFLEIQQCFGAADITEKKIKGN